MKRIMLFVLGFVFAFDAQTQEWFPVGASWYYNQVILLQGETYRYFEVTGDTIIQGKTCKVISGYCNCGTGGFNGIFYQDGDKVYGYHTESDSFRIFYDFSLVAGDTIVVKSDQAEVEDGLFLIDSLTTVQFGAQNLRVQHLTNLAFDMDWGTMIIEHIGSNVCLYPQVTFCDPGTGGLRCYEDEITGLVNLQSPPRPCYYTTAVDDLSPAHAIKIYPNPATNMVQIQSEVPIEDLVVYNVLSGPVLYQSDIFNTDFEMDLRSFPGGVYYFQVLLSDQEMVYRAVVIQR